MKFKYRALITAPPILPKIYSYKNLFDEKSVEIVVPPYNVEECLYEEQLLELLKDIDGILCGDDKITEDVLIKANKLKIISKWGTGIDSIDIDAAKRLGVKVMRVKNIFSEPVSDTVLAYIFLFSRNIIEKDRIVRNNQWRKTNSFSLKEKSLGIIGLGHIGKVVANKALSLGMKVFGYDVKEISNDYINRSGIKIIDFDELLKRSDFITLHCDLNKTSYHLIGKNQLEKMKSEAVLINTSRGEVLDEEALQEALQKKIIYGAALDVFEVEPLPDESILKKLDNVFLSPHNSNGSPLVFNNVDKKSIYNLLSYMSK
jgi:D-3-phosphoglycerate dehydrogenase